jgi:hypothetical protein
VSLRGWAAQRGLGFIWELVPQIQRAPPKLLVAHRRFCEVRNDPEHLGDGAMLSDQVLECLRHAEDCVQQAASQNDPKLRQDYLIITACWLKLSRELSELPAEFSKPERHTAPAKLKEGREERTFPAH